MKFLTILILLTMSAHGGVKEDLDSLGHDIWLQIEACGYDVKNAELFKQKLIADNDVAKASCLKANDAAAKKRISDAAQARVARKTAADAIKASDCDAVELSAFNKQVCKYLQGAMQ